LLKALVLGEVSMEDVDIRSVPQLCRYLLLGRSFVTDQADDQVFLLFRKLVKELELGWIRLGNDGVSRESHKQTHTNSL
jgi:hypothetical protein